MSATRIRARVEGTVQGVGFRPFVYRLAGELGLAGFVRNDSRGVDLEVEGEPPRLEEFLARLSAEAPPQAVIERVRREELAAAGDLGFRILESVHGEPVSAPVTPDSATCARCLAELFDPADRRYRYPFINCTDCGPRFTIVRGTPYDRPLTTMASFRMCAACQAEYEDPSDRRFHAQPNACPECGPQLTLLDRGGRALAERADALAGAVRALAAGRIVAVKGLGGFHVACLASDEAAVVALRARKHRDDKPFALMARDLAAARELVELTGREEILLTSPQRPIVLARRRPRAPVAQAVAPRSADLGVMLPYSPLHHLLLDDLGDTLVMTSGNVSDEPIAYRDEDALERLAAIADLFLLHDRPIETRTDDSVARAISRRAPLLIRRSRGYVPAALPLPAATQRPVLGCGAELKSTFCLAARNRAWVSHHIGDLENFETLRSFTEGIDHFERLFAIRPELVAHDLHPEYLSTKYALELADVELVGVQHHHAHLAACLAEHGERGPAVGAIYDGTGYGTDGTVWGGELLVADLQSFERAGHLWPVHLPGGEAAVREPWRMACAWQLATRGSPVDPPTSAPGPAPPRCASVDPPGPPRTLAAAVDPAAWNAVSHMCARGFAAPLTTSAGRLFDAVAALAGVRSQMSYEGQAAAELESAVDRRERGVYSMPLLCPCDEPVLLDARQTILAVLEDVRAGAAPATIAARFHNALAAATASALVLIAARRGLETVVLSGGSFQNRTLLEQVSAHLRQAGLRVLVPQRLPCNDGGIAYGQAAVAAARSS